MADSDIIVCLHLVIPFISMGVIKPQMFIATLFLEIKLWLFLSVKNTIIYIFLYIYKILFKKYNLIFILGFSNLSGCHFQQLQKQFSACLFSVCQISARIDSNDNNPAFQHSIPLWKHLDKAVACTKKVLPS